MTEHDFQCNIVRTLRMQNILCFAVPNSQSLMKIVDKRYKHFIMKKLCQEGFLTGAPDLIVVYKGRAYFLEIKRITEYKISEKTGKKIIAKKGTQSDKQKKIQSEIEKEGFPYLLIDSWEKFEQFLECLKKQKSFYIMENITARTGYQVIGEKPVITGIKKIPIEVKNANNKV